MKLFGRKEQNSLENDNAKTVTEQLNAANQKLDELSPQAIASLVKLRAGSPFATINISQPNSASTTPTKFS